jgi:muramoyltetrapeptide carboxypeptidase
MSAGEDVRPLRALRPGDLIGVCAPAGPVEEERLRSGVAALERLGFGVRLSEGILARTGFTAGSAAARREDLLALLRDEEVRAVVCARGGAGAIELLPALDDVELFRRDPKPLVGYSDITFLHLLLRRFGLVSLHGPMAARGLDEAFDEASFLHGLTGEGAPYTAPTGTLRSLRDGEGEGTLVGGCLSILAAAAGTPWALLPATPAILFLEDVGEPCYRIHRMLHQLRLSGALERMRGVVFGEMADCGDASRPQALEEVCAAALDHLEVPLAIGLPSGHTSGPAVTLPLGVPARLICEAGEARFEVLERAAR